MGTLKYDSTLPPITIPDRTLQHLHLVVTKILRQHERVALVVTGATGTAKVWVDAKVPVVITYATSLASSLNARWLAELEASFDRNGLVVGAEPVGWVRGRIHVELGKQADLAGNRSKALTEYADAALICSRSNDPACEAEADRFKKRPFAPK